MMMLMTVKTVITIIQTPFFFFWNFRLGEILDRQFRKYKTVHSMEVYCDHKSGLLIKFWFEMN